MKQTLAQSLPDWVHSCIQLARYDKPIGTWLVYLPYAWSIALAAPSGQLPDLGMLALFGLGAVLLRGAICTVNDMLDQSFDRQVERTKSRPLASGAVTNLFALLFLGVQLAAYTYLLLKFNWYTVGLGFAPVGLSIVYPLFKRFTYWPQLALGLTINCGVWIGYSAITGSCSAPICTPLYLGGIQWTIIYDTVYATQDIEDDLRIGVKSTAILFGENTKPYLSIFHAAMTTCLLTLGANIGASWIYYAGCTMTMSHLAYLIYRTDLKNPESCSSMFKANKITGIMLFATIVLEKLFPV